MRSVFILPKGTFSQAPLPESWWTQSNSRSRSSPTLQPGRSLQQQCVGDQPVGGIQQGLGEFPVAVRWQVAGQRAGQAGNIGAEQQLPCRGVRPSPFGDFAAGSLKRHGSAGLLGRREYARRSWCSGPGQRDQVRSRYAGTAPIRPVRKVRVQRGDIRAEMGQPGRERGHGMGHAGYGLAIQIPYQGPAQGSVDRFHSVGEGAASIWFSVVVRA